MRRQPSETGILILGDAIRIDGREIFLNTFLEKDEVTQIGDGVLMASTILLKAQAANSFYCGKQFIIERLGALPIVGKLLGWLAGRYLWERLNE